jgi:hypothetical protein
MKVTINLDGPQFVGRRILIPLHTKDVAVARKIRDGILVALKKSGVLSRQVNEPADLAGVTIPEMEETREA